jgi:hypothetical protein
MMTLRTRLGSGLVLGVLAGTQLWCASSEDPPSSVPEVDSGPSGEAGDTPDTGSPDTSPPPAPTCTEHFCRVALAGSETVALTGAWARSSNDVWVVGSSGFAARFDGTSWSRIATGTKQRLYAVWGSSDGAVWATSTGNAFFRLDRLSDAGADGDDAGFAGVVTAISGSVPNDIYAVGEMDAPLFDDEGTFVRANIWRYANHGSGSPTWAAVSPPCESFGTLGCPTFHAVWAASSDVTWFAGDRGKVYHTSSDGGTGDDLHLVETSSSSLRRLSGLWGSGPDDLWAVGAQGVIRHWSGGEAWSIVASPTTEDLNGVWGSRPDDVWAVGESGTVIHWNGQAWSVVEIPVNETNRPRLYAVTGSGSDIWIVGENTLLRSKAGGAP